MADDWRLNKGLGFLVATLYALLPADWMVYGPFRQPDGLWGVGCRPTNGPVEAGCVAVNRDLAVAFRLLADKIRARHFPPRLPN